MLTPEHISLLMFVGGLIMGSLRRHALDAPASFLCLGGVADVLLFGLKAVHFILYLRNNKH
jgi:hypothetical protein